MNANELADAMEIRASIRRKATSRKSVQENANDRLADQLDQAATMLRQQQAEIEALKQIIDANNLNQNIGQFVKPTNEPVAWISVLGVDLIGQKFTDVRVSLTKTDVASIPLYTHPVKELTREDRLKLIGTLKWAEDLLREAGHDEAVSDVQDCLMILRKAQEK